MPCEGELEEGAPYFIRPLYLSIRIKWKYVQVSFTGLASVLEEFLILEKILTSISLEDRL